MSMYKIKMFAYQKDLRNNHNGYIDNTIFKIPKIKYKFLVSETFCIIKAFASYNMIAQQI